MLFSVFTPTHRPKGLLLTAKSLVAQRAVDKADPTVSKFMDYEWVIGLNNGAKFKHLPKEIRTEAKREGGFIRIVEIPPDEERNENIGYIKHMLCGMCEGDYLVELDHDDELHQDALQTLASHIDEGKKYPDFLYSDSVHIHDKDGTTQTYSGKYGWGATYEVDWKGKKYQNNTAFKPTAASLYNIFHSPDHVRVWRREFYQQIGGHNIDLFVAYDHDLLQRTYIAGGSMVHIPLCLYIYHLHEDASNSYLERNAAVQTQQAKNGQLKRDALIRQWCWREKLLRVELGGKQSLRDSGVLGVGLKNADVEYDITQLGLIFPDNSVGHIHAQDFLEHIPSCKSSSCLHNDGRKVLCTVGMMNEIWRVLAPNGWFTSSTPSSDGRGAFQDPSHVSFWNPNSFWYYTRKQQAAYLSNQPPAKFIERSVSQGFPSAWHREHNIPYVDATLVALKVKGQPGVNGFWPQYP